MNSEKTTVLVPATVGAPFEGGFYGGKVRIGDGIVAVVWAPKAHGEVNGLWLPSYKDVPNATSCFDSMSNTVAMAEAGSPIAKLALAADIAGYKDWCIPARDVLELGYRHLKPTTETNYIYRGDNPSSVPVGYPYTEQLPRQTSAQAFQAGGPEAFDEIWYLSSTQASSSYAWFQHFGNGVQGNGSKKFEGRARLVRLIQLNA